MPITLDPAEPDLRGIIRSGDRIVWGQACGEPSTLVETLLRQRHEIGPMEAFVGAAFSDTLQLDRIDGLQLRGFGGIGTMRRLTRSGSLGVVPCHVGQIARYIEDGIIGCDVAMVQVAPAGADGRHSYGVVADYIPAAVARARLVIAEINDQVPQTAGIRLDPQRITHSISTSRPVVEAPSGRAAAGDEAIARHVAGFIGDGTVLQVGIGAVPDAILRLIADRRDLGFHSGMLGDGFVDLAERGAITNARKPFHRGVTLTGALIGTRRLYDFAHRNKSVELRPSPEIADERVLASIPNLVSINSAIEVDLTGQVNAEQAGEDYLGGVGGQPDFVRAGHRSPGGRSIIALGAAAKGGSLSKIVARLSGGITTARSDVDLVVTEYGVAELRAQPLAERARRLIAIAHPEHRQRLEQDAHELFRRGF